MAGSYCKYCDQRCFVYRQVIDDDGEVTWAGHMATCAEGAAHSRRVHGGIDFKSAHNPHLALRYQDDDPADFEPRGKRARPAHHNQRPRGGRRKRAG